jgi:hypothetical protein
MSRQLDQTITDAGAKNLSFVQALESLADMELFPLFAPSGATFD